jgi:membrane protease YdiL (CAAX protease family)
MGSVEGRRVAPASSAARTRLQVELTETLILDWAAALTPLLPVPIIVMANVAVGKSWASDAAAVLCGITAGAVFLFGLAILARWLAPGTTGYSPQPLGFSLIGVGAVAAVATWPPVLRRLARFLPLDPQNPVDALALALAVVIIGSQFAFASFVDVLASDQAQPTVTVPDLLSEQLPLLVVATVGVGIFLRRDATSAARRLGLVRPAWWHVVLALAAAGVFIGFSVGMDALGQSLTPGIANRVQATTNHLFGDLVGNPIGVLAIAVVPGLCEETLFRGAVQPRLGILLTALLFASIHTQYSLSFDTLAVFTIGIGLGLIRKYTNTTTSCVAHATYNLVTAVGLAGVTLGIAGIVELGLVVVAAYAVWTHRRSPTAVAP